MTNISPEPQEHLHPKRLHGSETKHVLVATADTPHRVMSAGQAIIFVLLTLLVGMILNSSSLYTRATTMNPSITRTVAMKTLRPFDLVSRAVGLTSLRQHSRSALNLPRDDKVDTFTFSKEKFTAPPVTTTLPVLGPTNKVSMWIIGDSLSITPSESMLSRFPANDFDIQGTEGHVSTGIARPDVFNWFTTINDYVVAHHPKVVVATFGANDDQWLYGGAGAVGPFGSAQWIREYRRRVSSTLDFLASQGTHTIWVAIPPVRDPARDAHYRLINQITRHAVAAHKDSASYVETAPAFTNPDGSYSDSLPINGTPTVLRTPDGVHFTRTGGDVISDLVLKTLHKLYSF
jgi:hypothetical protein